MTIARTICLGFIAVILTGTLLLMLPISTTSGEWNNWLVALFTSTSAVCVTGLIVVDTGTHFSFWGQLFITLLIQVGGLGYMTCTTFLILLIGGKFDLHHKFAIRESFDRPFLQGSRQIITSIIATTLVFELAGVILMLNTFVVDHGLWYGLWCSIFHTVSAFNNAGFSLFYYNLMPYQTSYIINIVITLLIIFGGIGYQTIIEMYYWFVHKLKKDKSRFIFSLNFKVATSTTLILLTVGTIMLFLSELNNFDNVGHLTLDQKILAAWFQSVTARTAGFNTIDQAKLTTASLFITMGLMFVGASPSGTGGGIKTTTLRIISTCTRAVLRGHEQVIMYEKEVPFPLVLKAIAVVFGSSATIIIATCLISFSNPEINLIQIFFEVISAFATVGLSTGITANLSAFSQVIIVITMYAGRVGVLLLIAAIIGDPRPTFIKYPQENLLVG